MILFYLALLLPLSVVLKASDNSFTQARNILLLNYIEFNEVSESIKITSANLYIAAGGLKGILANGVCVDSPEAKIFFRSHKNSLLLVERCLRYGHTLTATPRMLNDSKYTYVSGRLCLNMSQNGLVTVRDWNFHERFNHVKILDLSYNPLSELPMEFFKLFPKLQKLKIDHTGVEHLFTEHVPHGLHVVAHNSNLKTITTNGLATKCLLINALNTPLAKNQQELEKINAACKPSNQSCLARSFYCCWCFCNEDPEDYVSVINI